MKASREVEVSLGGQEWHRGLTQGAPDSLWSLMELNYRLADTNYLPTLDELRKACPRTPSDQYGNNAWNELTRERQWGEFLNTDFVNALAAYTITRSAIYQGQSGSAPVLEIGAGSGRLAQFLRPQLAANGVDYIATDADMQLTDWLSPSAESIEMIDYKEALKKYNPCMVICSWMPYQVDFTQAIRSTPGVKEYVLIGNPDMCGAAWDTYGIRSSHSPQNERKPYQTDGFFRVNQLNNITRYQTAYSDPNPYTRSTSTVLAYRRKGQ